MTRRLPCFAAILALTGCIQPAPFYDPAAISAAFKPKKSIMDFDRCRQLAKEREAAPLSAADQDLLKILTRATVIGARSQQDYEDCMIAADPSYEEHSSRRRQERIHEQAQQELRDRGGKPFGPPTPGPQICRSTYLPVTGDTITVCD